MENCTVQEEALQASDLREFDRYYLSKPISGQVVVGKDTFVGDVFNISEGGFFLLLGSPGEVGPEVGAKGKGIVSAFGNRIEVEGEVVRYYQVPAECGVAFKWGNQMNSELRSKIISFILDLQSKRAAGFVKKTEGAVFVCGHVSAAMLSDILGGHDCIKELSLADATSVDESGIVMLLTLQSLGYSVVNPNASIEAALAHNKISVLAEH